MKRSGCLWVEAWTGQCQSDCEDFICDKHKLERCCSCGEQATHSCEETCGLVCGFPLCDACTHRLSEDGTNVPIGGKSGHCKKTEQRFKPWYIQDADTMLKQSEAGR